MFRSSRALILGFALLTFPLSGPSFAQDAPLTNPSMGMGLAGISDWSTESPFIDVFKTARDWIGHKPGQWGGVPDEDVRVVLDKDGWPTRMPKGASKISTIILTQLPAEMTSAAGTYRLTYKGSGTITVTGPQNVKFGDHEITFDYTPNGENMVAIEIQRINSADPIRDISVVHSRNIARFDAREVFEPLWLQKISDMRLLRFMDWMRTNDSELSKWSDRAVPGDFSYATSAGVPVEIMVALANDTGTDPWFTLPAHADQDYIDGFVTYVRDHLDPKLKAWFEYSNEVWNWQFGQANWAKEEGEKLWPGEGTGWVQFYAGQAVNMAMAIDRIYGAEVKDRAVKVISTQTGWTGLEDAILDAPAWRKMDPKRQTPASYFDAYAITGYFDGGLGRDEKPNEVKKWIAASRQEAEEEAHNLGLTGELRDSYINRHRYDRAGETAVRELRDGSVLGDEGGTLKALYQLFTYHKARAEKHGLQLVMYEGGTHLVGVGPWMEDPELSDFFVWLNGSDLMGPLYDELMQGWKAEGGTLFNAFIDIGPHNKFGSWGNLRHLDDQSARWDALTRFNRDNPGWWEDRAEGTFIGANER